MTMSGSLGAPHPSTCWVQNRAQHGEGQEGQSLLSTPGHPWSLGIALRARQDTEGGKASSCWDVVN